ncbi:hypothetical protein [Sulfurisphaera tokodaii]|uniref:Uncharacterized protein n=2 Tax=Sulfurisphaera tokodaii TaxID=111955 RepID=Q970S4_SULTO|nr:hypothetical protein [Sulfurisphaera tokodaii]BAB66599.1 hypothetical protein STK_15280 [Sulfurisphaera tokodaii str. 7]HII73583.1 hypothetical protein [Sulfurisphaera tokodaii]
MKLQGIDISSILKPEAKYVILTKKFVSSLAEDYPDFISYNEMGIKLRELIVVSKKGMYTGYKYSITANKDGGLTSLIDDDKVIIALRAKKLEKFLTAELRFLGFKKDNLDKILILHDVPVIGNNREELINDIKEYLKLWNGIEISDLPAIVKPEYKTPVKGKILDVDYADLAFTV